MTPRMIILIASVSLFFSCKKDPEKIPGNPTQPPVAQLRDINWQHLPSPFYHFEYNAAGEITKASYSSGTLSYEILYTDSRILEARNQTAANKDVIQYSYENGMVSSLKYVNEQGITYKRCFLSYNNSRQLTKMEWEFKIENLGFAMHRTVTFKYYADGNLEELVDQRHAIEGRQNVFLLTERFENYDQKKNVDGFSLLHRADDHLVLLPGLVLQKNNPGKIIRGGDGLHYEIGYSYAVNSSGLVISKKGDMHFTNGPDAGNHFEVNVSFIYND